ncbi:TolC family protein [Pseudomonas sp. SWRI99]|uniref:TolC family protein n=1 Tax=Pseudomonas sp. SWRI99 TaxID=2745506 RepID=UPI0016453AEF|nr:TolC family protein [Pseudomonas sp. SWRI99]MBC3776845.1 TolC family protein [Pseudomonas sp. SWRI99]
MTQIQPYCARSRRAAAGPFARFFRLPTLWLVVVWLLAQAWSMPVHADTLTFTATGASTATDAVPGVSALATAALPPRLAARTAAAAGPSEKELRDMFYRAVQAAAERSPQVQRALAEHEAAEADVDEAKGQRWPQVDLGTQSKAARFGSGADGESPSSSGINMNVTTPIYDWGRISKTIESRRHLSKAASSGIEAELEASAYDVTTTMVELGKQRIIIDISQQFVDRMDELVRMLAGIVAVDKGRASELTQAKARLLQAQAARDTAQTRARDAEINLRKLVGERPLLIPRTREWNIRLANLDNLLARTEDHPTIHQAKARTESAELQAQVVRSSSLPQLNWVISKTTADDALGREQPWQTSLAVTWGAFRGGSARASERAALQRAEASRQETEQQRLDLEYRVRTADHDARTLLERAELYRDLTVESERIRLAFYEQWYHLGKRTLLDVLIAENDHYGNQVSEITNRFDGYQAIFRQYAGAGVLAGWLRGSQP